MYVCTLGDDSSPCSDTWHFTWPTQLGGDRLELESKRSPQEEQIATYVLIRLDDMTAEESESSCSGSFTTLADTFALPWGRGWPYSVPPPGRLTCLARLFHLGALCLEQEAYERRLNQLDQSFLVPLPR